MTQGVWRSGRTMVMREDAELPDRCVKTNVPADGHQVQIRLGWHHPALYLLLLWGVIPYFIVAAFVRTSVTVRVGVSKDAFNSTRRWYIAFWLLVAGALGMCLAAIYLTSLLLWVVLALLVAAVVVYLSGARIVWATRMGHGYVWIDGVNRDYLASLPEWRG